MGLFGGFGKSKKKPKKEGPPIFTFAISTPILPDENEIVEKLDPIIDTHPELMILTASLNFNIEEIVRKFNKIFPDTQIIGIRPRGIIGTENVMIPKQGIGLISFSREFFRTRVRIPENSKEHKIEEGLPVALENFVDAQTEYASNFKSALNLFIGDSYQSGHKLIDIYEKELNEKGIFNIPLIGAILHPEISQKQSYLTFANENKTESIRNGFVFISIFTRYNIDSEISSGLHPLIPFKITDARESIVLKLNNEPAFITYKKYIKKKGISEETIKSELPLIFATYQFGFPNPRSYKKPEIRVAIRKTEEDGLEFNGEILKGSTVWIMEADTKRMLEHTKSLVEKNSEKNIIGGIIFSSIFRLISMKMEYLKDITSIRSIMKEKPFLMFNTYLEIYYNNSKDAYSNSSTNVINIFYE